MTIVSSSSLGAIRAFLDSGAPEGSTDYTTLVLVHGLGWHGGSFKKLVPLAKQYNARIVGVNRRDYPGSDPYTTDELATLARLAAAPATPEAAAQTESFMRDRARELFDFLVDFVRRERVPPAQGGTGGLVVAGWSLGTIYMTALLANVHLFAEDSVPLSKYVRRIIIYDTTYRFYGYEDPPVWYHPLYDTSLPDAERSARFVPWVAGYYAHGDAFTGGIAALELRTPLTAPPPSTTHMSPADLTETTYGLPEARSDRLLLDACRAHGTYAALREGMLYPREPVEGASDWRGVEVRHLWCDHSVYEIPWGTKVLAEELEEAVRAGKPARDVVLVRLKGANHFAHWDLPEKTLQAFLGNETVVE